ncbi:multivesicular body subunit 12A [Toxorhynchites rutilus septentrionalis]|uniref:multivesicular body subunit 12A n=1 Tax=Toxorhynchites rutilus septentrionalis TaxID=329112 RepID=UPI00247A35EF|nr:multivesicular body subunit 12A [Toxorhynchites rutilus septentrionalis]
MLKTKSQQQKNILNTIISALPDNRPITSLQLVEDYEKCPNNFQPINKTYDQDQDADLWRENILFGRRSSRYLCLSKTEGLPDYILETLKVIGDKEALPEGFSQLTRTADSEQKAWRKKQIVYRLAKKGVAKQAITDIILCSRLRQAPEGFSLAGEVNGILICYKTTLMAHRAPPSVPSRQSISDLEKTIEDLKIQAGQDKPHSMPLEPLDHDYEQLLPSYQISPKRPAPMPPAYSMGTLNVHTGMEGVPFILNPALSSNSFELPQFYVATGKDLTYDFQLERQILCTTKTTNAQNKNPFFH